ncbi:MAG: ATP-binding protein, partial [Deltaproteobacteria bacterium]
FQTATGYSAEEISRMHPLDFFAEDDRENMAVKIREILAKGKAQAEAKVVSKEGRITPYFLMCNRICIDDRVYIIGMGVDITEKKKVEQELLKMQKLDSLGILAGGIAHDFNNVLTAILGNISLAKMRTGHDDKISKTLTDAEKGCFRARELTRQLITFSKGGLPVKRTASLIELIKDSTTFTLSGSKTKPEFYIPEDIWPVEADEGQISQVINNLVLNADQAMPEGGIIEIRGENIILSEEEIPSLNKGSYIKIMVKDYGIGIANENLQKIFDPYFTTKQKGSGLGLATTYSIIRNHDGYISVESEIGKGTTFSIYLPASEKEAAKKEDVKRDYITGSGRILIMDDEDIVRDVTGDILTMLGYEVDFAKDGKEAIELYKKAKESSKSFDVVIIDLTIPGGMGGKETVKKLLEIDPDVKAIVSSGYSSDPIMSEYKSYGFRGVVVKPYNTVELSRIVADVVKGRAG